MGILFVPLSLILGFIIIAFELLRRKKEKIDFLTGINFVYFLCFVIAPLYLNYFRELVPSNWGFLYKTELESANFIYAGFLSVLGYLMIISGFYFFKKSKLNSKMRNYTSLYFTQLTDKQVLKIALLIGFLGIVSFTVYTIELGGVLALIETGILLRGSAIEINSPWLFLKNITPFILISSFFFFALRQTKKGKWIKRISSILFLITFALSLLHLYHQAGRMTLLTYIMTFPLAVMINSKKIKIKYLVFGTIIFIILVIFGKQIFSLGFNSNGISNRLDLIDEIGQAISLIIVEFSFPFATLGNAVGFVPESGFRYFIDFILGFLSIMPDSVISTSHIDTVNAVNTAYFGTSGAIPVDIVSFGYYSLGIAGVIIICFSFGMVVSLCDTIFSNKEGFLSSILKAQWIIFLSFRVTYADPKNVLVGGFALIVTTIFLFSFYKYKNKSSIESKVPKLRMI